MVRVFPLPNPLKVVTIRGYPIPTGFLVFWHFKGNHHKSKLPLEFDLFRVRTRRFYNRLGRKQCPHVETVMKQVSSFTLKEF